MGQKKQRVPGMFSMPADLKLTTEGGYLAVLGVVGMDRRDLVWGSMLYGCTDQEKPPRLVPPDWDSIVERAPEGYWERRGGVPEVVTHPDGRRWFPPEPGGCGYVERYYLGLGVEGPEELREKSMYVPCPFVAGSCPNCGKPMTHVRWNEDETFDEPRPVPEGARYFRLPGEKEAREWAGEGYGGAELVKP